MHAAVEVEIPGERAIGNNVHGRVRFIQAGCDGMSRPQSHIGVGMAYGGVVSGFYRAYAGDKGPGAGAQVASARFYEVPEHLPSGRLQAPSMGHGFSAVHVHHPEPRLPVGVQQDAVFVYR